MSDGLAPAGLSAFWRWWTSELRGAIPAALAHGPSRPKRAVVFVQDDGGIEIRTLRNGRSAELARIEGNDPAAIPDEIRSTIAAMRRKGARIGVLVRPEAALVRPVKLPREAERELAAIMAHQFAELSPFPLRTVYHSYAVTERSASDRMITVMAVIVPRAVVDALRVPLAEIGIAPDFADLDGPDAGIGNLLAAGPGDPPVRRRLVPVLIAANALLLCALIGVRIADWSLERGRLEQAVEIARANSRVVRALADKIAEFRTEQDFLEVRTASAAVPLEILDELTNQLPDDTWLDAMSLQDGKVIISGHSASAADLIGGLEKSRLFARVQFAAPITKDQKTGRERFRLELPLSKPAKGAK